MDFKFPLHSFHILLVNPVVLGEDYLRQKWSACVAPVDWCSIDQLWIQNRGQFALKALQAVDDVDVFGIRMNPCRHDAEYGNKISK